MRLRYNGGDADGRIKQDKLKSLKKAMAYSYQAETIILNDGREFRCLINPDKQTMDYDDKMISIPFKDVCLNSPKPQEIVDIGLKCGNTFTWKETNTHWIVYSEYLEENANAYFRAQIRKCEQQTEINGQKYWTYIRGPVETALVWNQKGGVEWNDLNYSLIMYITKDENTQAALHRFTKIKITEPGTDIKKTWQVVAVNPYYGDGMIQVVLDEYFENSLEDAAKAEKEANQPELEPEDPVLPHILGPLEVYSYDTVTYTIENACCGKWVVRFEDQEYIYDNCRSLTLDVKTKRGTFTVAYMCGDEELDKIEVAVVPF